MPSSAFQTCALRSEEHTSELQSHDNLVCRLPLQKKKNTLTPPPPRRTAFVTSPRPPVAHAPPRPLAPTRPAASGRLADRAPVGLLSADRRSPQRTPPPPASAASL